MTVNRKRGILCRTLRKGTEMRHAVLGAVAALAGALVLSSLAGAQTAPSQTRQTQNRQTTSPWVYYPQDTIAGDGGPAPKRDPSGTWAGPGSNDAIPRGAAAE